jgi:putative acetyltransferase
MDMILRPIEEKDNKEIAELIRTVFREFNIHRPGTVYFDPTTDHLFELFTKPGSEYWIAEENGIITGGCGVYPTPGLPEGCAELVKFYLSATQRGKGIGRKLMEKTFESAINLYEKAGFEFIKGPMGDSGHFGCNIWMLKDLQKSEIS